MRKTGRPLYAECELFSLNSNWPAFVFWHPLPQEREFAAVGNPKAQTNVFSVNRLRNTKKMVVQDNRCALNDENNFTDGLS